MAKRSTQHSLKSISVIGDGGWGTTLAIHLHKQGYPVTLWGAFPDYVRKMQRNRYNPKFLPGVIIPRAIELTDDLKYAVNKADLLVLAVPSEYTRGVLKKIANYPLKKKVVLSVTKGIENKTLFRISEIVASFLGPVPFAVLSGPTIAREVVSGIPSTAVVASRTPALARQLQKIFNSKTFRIYTNRDVPGVELGGSLKNIIAIACGVCDGLGFGSNTKAAILTRGVVEMARLGKALGAQERTFSGLAGLGDLVTTCVSPQSRNRYVGEELGKGRSIKQIIASMSMVAEGVATVKAVHRLGQKHKIPLPICTEVYHIIYRNKDPKRAVVDLMTRKLKSE